MTPEQETAFLVAREAVDRSSFTRYLHEQNITQDDENAIKIAVNTFQQQRLLDAPELRTLASAAAKVSRGRLIKGNDRFIASLWLGGATDTHDGRDFLGNLSQFVALLRDRSNAIAPKREGWVVEPTTNPSGRRTNTATEAMHALFLDADNTGEWNTLLTHLETLNYAFIAYQSGGWTPTTPKWRVVLPLHEPFLTPDESSIETWKQIYNHCRVIFGTLGELRSVGFDPATETPCCPWFLTERRSANDPSRQIIWHEGHSLDLMSLVLELPPIEIEAPHKFARTPRDVVENGLSDEKLDEIINALVKVTANVPSGRHDLYLALPGVLLDRGVSADEVLTIIEAVSASYPRVHNDKHKDNLHNARTTIGKWESGEAVTRIGTLNDRWPEIAHAVDAILPDPLSIALLASTTAMIDGNKAASLTLNNPLPTASEKKRRRRLSPLGKEVVKTVKMMKVSPKANRRFGASLIEKILDGDSFQTGKSTPEQVDSLVNATMLALGFNLPSATTWQEVLDLANVTLLSMDFTQSIERVAAAEKAFLKGQRQKIKWLNKQKAKIDESRELSRRFLNDAEALMKGNR